jgi:hypothetical protein
LLSIKNDFFQFKILILTCNLLPLALHHPGDHTTHPAPAMPLYESELVNKNCESHLFTASEVCGLNWVFTFIFAKPGSVPVV